jgi:hypothetical protein
MALFSGVAGSAVPGRLLVAAITTFGAVRFAARALMDSASIRPLRLRWPLLGCFVAIITCIAVLPFGDSLTRISEIASTVLTVTGAVLTADFLSGSRPLGGRRKVDPVGITALLAGLVTPLLLPGSHLWDLDRYWLPWLFPSYGVAFLVCLCARAVQKKFILGRSENVPE